MQVQEHHQRKSHSTSPNIFINIHILIYINIYIYIYIYILYIYIHTYTYVCMYTYMNADGPVAIAGMIILALLSRFASSIYKIYGNDLRQEFLYT
jgi:hypothetical protein